MSGEYCQGRGGRHGTGYKDREEREMTKAREKGWTRQVMEGLKIVKGKENITGM